MVVHRFPLLLAAGALALGVLLIVMLISRPAQAGPSPTVVIRDAASLRDSDQALTVTVRAVDGVRLVESRSSTASTPQILAASADGATVAFSPVEPGQVGPLVIARPDGSQVEVALPGVRGAAFEPMGTWLAAIDLSGALWRVDPQTGLAGRLLVGPYGPDLTVLPDGRILAIRLSSVDAPYWSAVELIDADTGQPMPAAPSLGGEDQLVYQATALTDGTLAVARHRSDGGLALVRVGLDGSETALGELAGGTAVAFSPAGDALAWEDGGQIWLKPMGDRSAAEADRRWFGGPLLAGWRAPPPVRGAVERRGRPGRSSADHGPSLGLLGRWRSGVPAMTRSVRFLVAMAAIGYAVLSSAPPAAAADDFTLPFHNPAVTLSYGLDRDPRPGYQLDWAGQLWHDSVPTTAASTTSTPGSTTP